MSSAPIRFLMLLFGGWVGLRLIVHGVGFMGAEAMELTWPIAATARIPTAAERPTLATDPASPPPEAGPKRAIGPSRDAKLQPARAGIRESRPSSASSPAGRSPFMTTPTSRPAGEERPPVRMGALTSLARPASARPEAVRRWSASAWLLVRGGGDFAALAPGGTLGGSQAGARLLYRFSQSAARPLSISARLYTPLRRSAGAEAALGLDWRPLAAIPVNLLAERLQRLGREGRSAFSIAAYGGGSMAVGRGVRLDAYGQAGIVGLHARDAFADGAVRVVRPIGPAELGGAVWAAAQPGASRVDIGPQISLPLRTGPATLRLSAEWRFRISGDARPGSGPALTLGADF